MRRLLFAPGRSSHDRKWLAALYRSLARDAEVLYYAEDAASLSAGALPGSHTLLTPRYPALLDEALRLCDGMVTACPGFAEAAARHHIPHRFIDDNDRRARPSLLAARWVNAFEPRGWEVAEAKARETALEICAAADHRYLPFLVGFLANLQRLSFPLEHVHLLALDDKIHEEARARFPRLNVHRPLELWSEAEWRIVSHPSRGLGGRAFASKPRLLRHVWRLTKRPVLYSDLDIYYYGSPEKLAAAFQGAPALLFPQSNDKLWHSKFYGVFNAGMIGVQAGGEPFLHWWSERCLHDYNANFLQGYYADQGFLDLAPTLFPELRVYREGDHNLAYWNIESLVSSFRAGVDRLPQMRSGKPLQSFHAAVPDALGLYDWKAGWDQVHSFFAGIPASSREVLEDVVVQQQSEHWLDLSRLRKLQQLGLWRTRAWHPRVGYWALHSPLRHLLHGAARLHYRFSQARRDWRPEKDEASVNRSHLKLLRPSDDPRAM